MQSFGENSNVTLTYLPVLNKQLSRHKQLASFFVNDLALAKFLLPCAATEQGASIDPLPEFIDPVLGSFSRKLGL